MKNIDKLKNLVNSIKALIYKLPYNDNDVRKAYFENLYTIINDFYLGKIYFEISTQIKNGKVNFDEDIIDLKPHILSVYEIADHPLLSNGYHNELNRKLFIDSFTNFEITVDLCFDNLKTDIAVKQIVSDLNSRLIRLIKQCKNEEQIIDQLIKTSFIPLIRKFKYLSKIKSDCYGINYSQDIKFIEFCTKLRNCVLHSAGYYKGRDYEYEFDGVNFIFKNEEFLEMKGENDYVFLKLNERLTNIINQVFVCFNNVDYLKYPDDGF
ncbi:hypothetical protein [uncultured Formosa sp.]|uniref:hypothetical protein n=1 Tax=uncultured Formosa sp. TaxID=255435 RepID=UPI0026252C5E|nr:hypothetical protein [uncultured Formosa sp.]